MKGVQRDGLEYDFTIMFELDIYHIAQVSKDRTQLFKVNTPIKIDKNTGKMINEWCHKGNTVDDSLSLIEQISSCNDLENLYKIYNQTPDADRFLSFFNARANELRKIKNGVQQMPSVGTIISNGRR